jgi:hypothetical protein
LRARRFGPECERESGQQTDHDAGPGPGPGLGVDPGAETITSRCPDRCRGLDPDWSRTRPAVRESTTRRP